MDGGPKLDYIKFMSDFDKLCKEFEKLDVISYTTLLADRSKRILPALAAITQNGESGVEIFKTFILGAIVADGKLSEEEYALIFPHMQEFFGSSIDYEGAKKAFNRMRPEQKDLKSITDEMVDVLGILSDDLKNDIVLVCMLICAIDGKISLKEKSWIKQLLK